MNRKIWTVIGACYAAFAITIAMVAVEESDSLVADQTSIVAQADNGHALSGERLYQFDANPRRNLFLTIWSTRDCYGCQQMEAEIPALRKAGYNVVLRKVPAPRWVKSFPTIVVNRDRLNGPRVTVIAGFKTTAEIDAILQVTEEEDGEEADEEVDNDEDYNIFSPKAQVHALNLVVWLSNNEVCNRQYDEIAKLRKKGFSANVYMVETKRPPRHILSTPTVVLIDNRRGVVVAIWRRFVTAEEILDVLR